MQIPVITLTRKQLYDEVWEVSAAGVSRKYDIPYAQVLKQIKDAGIPLPPSGYWTKLSRGKFVEKTALPGLPGDIVALQKSPVTIRKKESETAPIVIAERFSAKREAKPDTPQKALSEPEKAKIDENASDTSVVQDEKQGTIEHYGQVYNVYDRETLYKEVWASPVTEVAKKYKVSDVAIHKVCKSLDIPTPPLGHWAKLRAGKSVTKTPLPKSNKASKKIGVQTGYTPPVAEEARYALDFLSEEDRTVVLAVASQILLPDENERMHSAIIAHRKVITEWQKSQTNKGNDQWRQRNSPSPPYLVGGISNASIPRACHIIDALVKAMEPLGSKLTDRLAFVVNGETVNIAFSESQDKLAHVLTKEENRKLLEYEERRKKYGYETKPQIRKYDYQYNGRLSLTVAGQKCFRDCKSYQLEDRLGDVLLELYVSAERLKQERLAREEVERKRQEEAKRKEERRNRYNKEVDRTIALKNEAEDYDKACKIRAYIAAYAAMHSDEDISEWISWAESKADWYDPTVSRKDELLGGRDHAKDDESKRPKHAAYWW